MVQTPPFENSYLTEEVVRRVDQPVYHYTHCGGLVDILESGQLWASEATSLNDLAEVRLGWEMTRTWLEQCPDHADTVYMLKKLCDDAQPRGVFVLSASIEGDDANQWRLYADGGRGYAIELDPAQGFGVASGSDDDPRETDPKYSTSFRRLLDLAYTTPWLHVLYRPDEHDAAMKYLVQQVARDMKELRTEVPTDAADEDHVLEKWEELRSDAYDALATIAHIVKSPGFVGEHEARIVATASIWAIHDDHFHFRPAPTGVVAYLCMIATDKADRASVVFDQDKAPLPLRSVRRGPLIPEANESTIRSLLKKRGYGAATVTASQLRLR